ncbi:MAG TPA: glycosyltransferase [Acidimicrobiales bacterium]|nr:glycosyltransferase [Acidimicrobiales bacterium]
MSSDDNVQVYVASANTNPVTELCVRSMHRYSDYPFRLIVGDNGSRDGSIEMLRELERKGWLSLDVASAWRQHGDLLDHWIHSCEYRYAVFVDSDVNFRGPWLRALVETAQSEGAALVCAEMFDAMHGFVQAGTGRIMEVPPRPSAHLMMFDTKLVAGLSSSFLPQISEMDGVITSLDVAGAVLRELTARGLAWREMPSEYQSTFVHLGGMSYLSRKLWPDLWPGWNIVKALTRVRLSLRWYRARWKKPSSHTVG